MVRKKREKRTGNNPNPKTPSAKKGRELDGKDVAAEKVFTRLHTRERGGGWAKEEETEVSGPPNILTKKEVRKTLHR